MNVCPSCNQDIPSLNYEEVSVGNFVCKLGERTAAGSFTNSNRNLSYEKSGFLSTVTEKKWKCPQCGSKMFDNEYDAMLFLNGVIDANGKATTRGSL